MALLKLTVSARSSYRQMLRKTCKAKRDELPWSEEDEVACQRGEEDEATHKARDEAGGNSRTWLLATPMARIQRW